MSVATTLPASGRAGFVYFVFRRTLFMLLIYEIEKKKKTQKQYCNLSEMTK